MQKFIGISLFLLINVQAFSQYTNTQQLQLKENYLQKSQNRKQAGFILLGTGIAALAVGIPIAKSGDKSLNSLTKQITGVMIAVGGGGLMLTSMFFFASSDKYKHKAAAISFNMEIAPKPCEQGFVQSAIPALKLKVTL